MFLLRKVFQLRDQANPNSEKPFLEHLEDLRIMFMRIILTLIVAMILCFTFQNWLMKVLLKPVSSVWDLHIEATLPKGVNYESWNQAKEILDRSQSLKPDVRNRFLAHFSDEQLRVVEAVSLLRAAKILDVTDRDRFLRESTAQDPALVTLVDSLLKSKADPDINHGSSSRMMSALSPTETFMLSMKLAFFAGIVVSFPFLLFFILQFVLPGMKQSETKVMWPSMAIGFGLFLGGVLFAYFSVLPKALVFFFEWGADMGVSNDWRIGDYVSFATQFTLVFGLAFELPVVIMTLVKLGLLTYETMKRTRSYAVLAIVVAAAMITPTSDILTLSLMAVPMYILYEICIWLAWWDHRKRRKQEEEEAAARRRPALTRLAEEDSPEPDSSEPPTPPNP